MRPATAPSIARKKGASRRPVLREYRPATARPDKDQKINDEIGVRFQQFEKSYRAQNPDTDQRYHSPDHNEEVFFVLRANQAFTEKRSWKKHQADSPRRARTPREKMASTAGSSTPWREELDIGYRVIEDSRTQSRGKRQSPRGGRAYGFGGAGDTGQQLGSMFKDDAETATKEDNKDLEQEHLQKIRSIYQVDYDSKEKGEDGLKLDADVEKLGEDDDENLVHITTGEDAIAYFASGKSTVVKFLTCNRKPCEISEFKPYDLLVTPETESNPEHFTISAAGVVHICPGNPSERISLADWMHQSMMFQVLITMGFFRLNIHRKMFFLWKRNVRQAMYRNTRAQLTRNLFFAKPTYAGEFKKINLVMEQISLMKLLYIENSLYSLNDFLDTQQKQLSNKVTKDLDGAYDNLAIMLEELLEKLQDNLKQAEIENAKIGNTKGSFYTEKLRKQRNKHRVAICKQNLELFGVFVKMIDIMGQAKLVNLVIDNIKLILERFNQTKAFSVTIKFRAHDEIVYFSPDEKTFNEKFTLLFDTILVTVTNVVPLTNMRRFDDSIEKKTQVQKISDVLNNNEPYQILKEMVYKHIQEDFKKAQQYSDSYFEPYRNIYDYGEDWHEDNITAETITTHVVLAKEMNFVNKFNDLIDKIKFVYIVGTLLLESRTLKASLQPITEKAMKQLKVVLQDFSRERCKVLKARFEKMNKDLDARPTELEALQEYTIMFKELKSQMEVFDDWKSQVEDMYAMIRLYRVKIPLDDVFVFDSLSARANEFQQEKMIEASSFIRDSNQHIRQQLDLRIEKVEKEMALMIEDILAGSLSQPKQEPVQPMDILASKNLVTLNEYVTKIKEYREQNRELNKMQTTFKLANTYVFVELDKLQLMTDNRLALWNLVNELILLQTRLLEQNIAHTDAKKFKAEIVTFYTKFEELDTQIISDDPDQTSNQHVEGKDDISVWIAAECDKLDNYCPFIEILSSLTSESIVWELVFKLIGMDEDTVSDFMINGLTLGYIVGHHMCTTFNLRKIQELRKKESEELEKNAEEGIEEKKTRRGSRGSIKSVK